MEGKQLSESFTVNGVEFVAVEKKQFDDMSAEIDWLMCLEAAGVDNWEGYEVAVRLRDGELQEGDL